MEDIIRHGVIEKITFVKPAELVGKYKGRWSGYKVEFFIGEQKYEFTTNIGVRGVNIPVNITIEKDRILLEVIK